MLDGGAETNTAGHGQLQTHGIGWLSLSLYETFDPATASALAQRLEMSRVKIPGRVRFLRV
jgi:hypothetical protein